MDGTANLNGLAAKIQSLTAQFTQYLQQHDIAEPSFAPDSPTSYTGLDGPSFMLRQELFDSLMDLVYLTQGPSESIFNYCHTVGPDTATLNVLNHFDFWSAVPLGESSTTSSSSSPSLSSAPASAEFEEIARKTNLPVSICERLIRHAITLRIFSLTSDGKRVQHTSRSAAIARSKGLRALVSTILDDAGPPMSILPEALRQFTAGKSTASQDPDETAFAVLHKHGGPYGAAFRTSWDLLENEGEGDRKGWRQRNFATFMRYVNDIFQFDAIIENGLDWKAAGSVRVIDVGGSAGHDSIALAQKFPNLTFVVQDLGQARAVFDANLPADLKDRVSFHAHDFFVPQPDHADIYLMKLILHDWPDTQAVQILRNLAAGMRRGSRLLFIDYVGKPTTDNDGEGGSVNVPRSLRAFGTATDIRMMALFNHRERMADEWRNLFRDADERFRVVKLEANPLSFVVVMEVVWEGDD